MRTIARHPGVHVKFSGMRTEPDADVPRTFDLLWNAFGPERLVWGSAWPVLTLAASHCEWRESAEALVPAAHHNAVFGANARRIYRLPQGWPDGGKGS